MTIGASAPGDAGGPKGRRFSLWAKALGGFFLVLVLLIGGAIAYPFIFGWNWARAPLAERLGATLGYTLAIDGDLDVSLGRITRVSADGVRLGNPDWASRPDMAKVERLVVDISLMDLMKGRVSLPLVALTAPDIALEKRADGKGNWEANLAAEAVTPDDRTDVPVVGEIRIDRGKIGYADAGSGMKIEADAATVEGQAGSGKPTISLKGSGILEGQQARFKLTGGSILSLRDNDEPYPVEVEAMLGDTEVTGRGTVQDPIELTGVDLALTLKGGSLRGLFSALGLTAPETPPFEVKGMLRKGGTVWWFEEFAGTIGSSDLSGTFRYDTAFERPYVSGELVSKTLDFADIGPLVGLPPGLKAGQPATPEQKAAAERVARDPRVLPDAPLDIERLTRFDADIKYAVTTIKGIDVPISKIDLTLKLKDSVMALKPLHFTFSGGTTTANITIDARKKPVYTIYDLLLQGMKADQLVARLGLPDVAAGTVRARIKLEGSGDSIRTSLANSKGSAAAVMDGGKISLFAMEAAGLDVAEGLAFLGKQKKTVPIRCMVANFSVEGGVMDARTLVLDTTDTTIDGKGRISLRDEKLDLKLEAHPKDFSPFSARSPILLRGTFKSPAIGIEPGNLAARTAGAVALGVLLTPLASVLAFIDPGGAVDSDCLALIKSAPTR